MVTFDFAYNNPVFSDRVLHMDVAPVGNEFYEVLFLHLP